MMMTAMEGEGILEGHGAELSRSGESTTFHWHFFVFLLHVNLSSKSCTSSFFFLSVKEFRLYFFGAHEGWTSNSLDYSRRRTKSFPWVGTHLPTTKWNRKYENGLSNMLRCWLYWLNGLFKTAWNPKTQAEWSAVFGEQWTWCRKQST